LDIFRRENEIASCGSANFGSISNNELLTLRLVPEIEAEAQLTS